MRAQAKGSDKRSARRCGRQSWHKTRRQVRVLIAFWPEAPRAPRQLSTWWWRSTVNHLGDAKERLGGVGRAGKNRTGDVARLHDVLAKLRVIRFGGGACGRVNHLRHRLDIGNVELL